MKNPSDLKNITGQRFVANHMTATDQCSMLVSNCPSLTPPPPYNHHIHHRSTKNHILNQKSPILFPAHSLVSLPMGEITGCCQPIRTAWNSTRMEFSKGFRRSFHSLTSAGFVVSLRNCVIDHKSS